MRQPARTTALLFAVLLTAPAAAPPAAAQTFDESLSVVVVHVPVHVLIDGQPVRGLGAGDFEILDGRRRQEIIGFEVVDLAAQLPFGDVTVTAGAAPAQRPLPIGARRHILLLFDLSFSQPDSLVAARRAARDLVLDRLHPSDLVAVATYSRAQGPRLVLGFTSDRDQAALAIETLGLPQLYESVNDPLALLLGSLEGEPRGRPGTRPGAVADRLIAETMREFARAESRRDRRFEQGRISRLSRSLGGLARLLNAVEGRKQVVYLSEGFDSSAIFGTQDPQVLDELARASEEGRIWEIDSDQRFGDSRSQNVLEEMLEEFRRAGATIQAVDIGGMRSEADVAFGSSRATAAGVATETGRRDGLAVMAAGTGGELFRSFNDLSDAMQRLLEHTGVTYLLAFQPDRVRADGSYHRIKVRLKDGPAGATVVHRPGYYAPLPYAETPAEERRLRTAAMIVGSAEGGTFDSAVLAAALPPNPAAGGRAYVPVLLEMDGPGLAATAAGPTLPLELFVYALDDGGRIGDFLIHQASVDLTAAGSRLENSGLKFFGHLELPPGRHELRVLARNADTGHYSLRGFPLRVADPEAARTRLLPPFFPEPFDRWILTREAGIEELPYPFMAGERPFLPAVRPVLAAGPVAVELLGYDLPAGEPPVTARALAADGRRTDAAVELAGRATGGAGRADALSLRVDLGALEPGDYRLEVTVGEPAGGAATSSGPFTIAAR